jgi:hypothetical protein
MDEQPQVGQLQDTKNLPPDMRKHLNFLFRIKLRPSFKQLTLLCSNVAKFELKTSDSSD